MQHMSHKEPRWKKGFQVKEDADAIEDALPRLRPQVFPFNLANEWRTELYRGDYVGISRFLTIFYRVLIDHDNELGSAEYLVFRYSSLGRAITRATQGQMV